MFISEITQAIAIHVLYRYTTGKMIFPFQFNEPIKSYSLLYFFLFFSIIPLTYLQEMLWQQHQTALFSLVIYLSLQAVNKISRLRKPSSTMYVFFIWFLKDLQLKYFVCIICIFTIKTLLSPLAGNNSPIVFTRW